MNGERLLVDTNILIFLLQGNPEIRDLLDGKSILISFVTELELLSIPHLSSQEQGIIEELIEDCRVIDIPAEVKWKSVEIRRTSKLKLPDSIILASSIYAECPLFTADKGFGKTDAGQVILYAL